MSDIEDRIVPDLEVRLEEAIAGFRDRHRRPENLALHAAALVVGLRAVRRLVCGKLGAAAAHGALSVALVALGHRIEVTNP